MAAIVGAHAAGGHFEVDDATVLDPGRCQVELSVLRSGSNGNTPAQRGEHFGPACRVGPVEAGLNLDRLRVNAKRADSAGPQVKWVLDLVPTRLSTGAVLGAAWPLQGAGRPLLSAYVPATLWLGANGELQLHLNGGVDRISGQVSQRRWGAAADWSVNDTWTLTTERRQQFGQIVNRIGTRYNFSDRTSLDISAARMLGTRLLAVGINHEWNAAP